MNNIIDKLGIEELDSTLVSAGFFNSRVFTAFKNQEVREIEQQRNELIELLDDIIRKQYDQSCSLAELNRSIRNARIAIMKMFPKIKELSDD